MIINHSQYLQKVNLVTKINEEINQYETYSNVIIQPNNKKSRLIHRGVY